MPVLNCLEESAVKRLHLLFPLTILMSWLVSATWSPPAQAYITAPVQTLGQLCGWSTYVTEVRVEKVSKEKGIIIYRKVRDLKGKYPRDTIRHVFDLKNTPAHQGSGAVPVRPDETDWKHAIQWAEPGKTAVVVALKYDPYGDFGHTYRTTTRSATWSRPGWERRWSPRSSSLSKIRTGANAPTPCATWG
jgi:hypothetical protein